MATRGKHSALAAAALALSTTWSWAADPDVLWHIVHEQCLPNQQQNHDPAPCESVDLSAGVDRGSAVLKDLVGATQFLLIPTTPVTGIESPALLAPDASNYWAAAWKARRFVFTRAHKELPRDAIGLAINAVTTRSQNQLHIHVDCIRTDVRAFLAAQANDLPREWSGPNTELLGHSYWAMRLEGSELSDANPFKLLADGIPEARQDMSRWKLVVVGASFAEGREGFVLLAGHIDPAIGDYGAGTELLDHACAVANSGR